MRLAIICLMLSSTLPAMAGNWTEFRGPGGTSIGEAKLPTEWNAEKNVAWTVDLPGRGVSGPIVVDDQVIVTASSGAKGDRLHVVSFDAKTGEPRWHRQFWSTGNLSCHPKMCMATPTPATDGKHILAFYSTNDLACLDLAGNVLWYRGLTHDYPNASNSVGMSASPVIAGDVAIVSVENEGDSFLAGIDIATGENLWREPRPKSSQWASPIALRGKTTADDLVVTQSNDGVFLRRPKTGEVLWKLDAKCSVIPSATIADNTVYVPADGIVAAKFELNAAKPEILWDSKKIRTGTPSPIYHDGKIYSINSAILSVGDAKTGESIDKVRLKGGFSSTPVIVGNHLYAFNEDGIGFVVKLEGDKVTLVSENIMSTSKEHPETGETILCSPAVANDGLFIRSDQHLWKIATTP